MTYIIIVPLLFWFCLAAHSASTRNWPPVIKYSGGPAGRVLFDHKVHASVGIRCYDCHTDHLGTGRQLFATKKQALIAIEDHRAGMKCFVCHNGKGSQGKGIENNFLYRWDVFGDWQRCHYSGNFQSGTAR